MSVLVRVEGWRASGVACRGAEFARGMQGSAGDAGEEFFARIHCCVSRIFFVENAKNV